MWQNHSQKLEMQIPQNDASIGFDIQVNEKEKLKEFLKNHYEFPSDNLNDIVDFISEDQELEKIVYDLPNLISKEINYRRISFDFMKETDPNEKILEIIIYSDADEKILIKKEDLISDEIIDSYPRTINEYIILVEDYV
ncbi:hypothetical protein [Methanobrevibacter sp.]|uniref:hypothetical protein n=1 Tax=Methanobrevibacter sp. TaxID=66852 RepID=UPI0025D66ECA|nr:hypothetical protein [Methanobrevibacter sp.]MBR4447647.1 hypothetical protein [Methanobrevibacter sp.]